MTTRSFVRRTTPYSSVVLCAVTLWAATPAARQGTPLKSEDLYALKSIADVQLSPDGGTIAYSIQNSDRPGRPYSQVWLMNVASGRSKRLGDDREAASGPRWSPDGKRVAFFGRGTESEGSGLMVANADGSNATFLAPVTGTNHPLPSSGDRLAWSPDGTQLAFVSATPGPEADANGDPMVITRYLYKPTASEGLTRFNDNRRLHIFVVDIASKQVQQLTERRLLRALASTGRRPVDEILFVSNRGPDPDRFFNYDMFAVKRRRRRTSAGSPTRRTPSTGRAGRPTGSTIAYLGTKRAAHLLGDDDGGYARVADGCDGGESARDRWQSSTIVRARREWSPDGSSAVLHRAGPRQHAPLQSSRRPAASRRRDRARRGLRRVVVGRDAERRRSMLRVIDADPPAELYVKEGSDAAAEVGDVAQRRRCLRGNATAPSRGVDVQELRRHADRGVSDQAGRRPGTAKHPMIVMIHGGPHGAQGPAFNAKAQVYAAHGLGHR